MGSYPLLWRSRLPYCFVRTRGGGYIEDVTLLLYLRDEEYGKRLLRFLLQKKNPGIHPELVTARSKMEFRIGTELKQFVVLTDDSGFYEDGKHNTILLSSQQDRTQKKIFQYQKAEGIYQELLWQLRLEPAHPSLPKEPVVPGIKNVVYAVFSPEAGEGTELAVTLAQYAAQKGKCLYLQMSGLPVYFGEKLTAEPDFGAKGVGELLFLLEQKDFAEQTQRCCHRFGKADMLPPAAHYKDLLDCRPEDWECFLRRLQKDCGYDSIVVEMGQVHEFFLDIMEKADQVLFLQPPGCLGRIRRAVFQRYCRTEGKDGLLSRTKYIRQPEEVSLAAEDWEKLDLAELAEDRKRMEWIKKLLEGGAEDDSIREDIE